MIINTGMRTDIPAFYYEWLINRIKEGFVLVRNPYNPSQVTRYSLSPEVVDLIAFCTEESGTDVATYGYIKAIQTILVRYHYTVWERCRA